MKKTILIIVFYLVGSVFGYNYTKFNIMSSKKEWTKRDRTFSLLLSSGSWLTVVSMGIVDRLNSVRNDEKAEW